MLGWRYGLMLSVAMLLTSAAAKAEFADISGREQVPVGSWSELKAELGKAENEGKVIVLTQSFKAGVDNPITSIAVNDIIIDGGGNTISGKEGFFKGQFIKVTSSAVNKPQVIFQNLKLEGFGFVTTLSFVSAPGGVIYNMGTIGDITGDFSGNYAQSTSGFAQGGAIYNSGSNSTIGDITGDFSGNYAQSTPSSAQGGAIHNSNGTIGNITGDFSGNYAQSTSAYAYGGAIYNSGSNSTIGDITGDFSGNYAQSTSAYAYGGAIYNYGGGTIENITGNFTNNFAQGATYAQGGAIYNEAKPLTLINSSFTGNKVISGATKESAEGQQTLGGAIFSSSDLTIKADNGQSLFSGNKIQWSDGEESSAIDMGLENTTSLILTLDSRNNGKIQFDDKISVQGMTIDYILSQVTSSGGTVTDDGNGGYLVTMGSDTIHFKKTDDGFLYPTQQESGKDITYVENLIKQAEQLGFEVTTEGDNYILTSEEGGMKVVYEIIKEKDGTYTLTENMFVAEYVGNMVISGDDRSQVVFNNKINGFGTIDISGTRVEANEGVGTISRTITHSGGVLNVNSGATAADNLINSGGTVNVLKDGTTVRTAVNDGGVFHVAAGGLAQDTTVNSGGSLKADAFAKLHNMLANDGALLDIDKEAYLTGNIIINAAAQMGGSYDYSQIFKDEVTDKGSLTLVGGLNSILNESSLINTTADKKLHLTDGDYTIGDGTQAVQGWDQLTFKNKANVKLEGDIAMSDASKKIFIEQGSKLDLAGHSPSNYTITGSLNNDGMITFSHADDEVDDITTIYGNYKAYNNAKMTIDVSPANNVADLLRIDGDVQGHTGVILNVLQYNVMPTQKIEFVSAPNDDLSTGAAFSIFRVDGSAYNWNVLYENGSWYTATDNIIPDGSVNGYGDTNTGNMADDPDLDKDADLPLEFPDVPSSSNPDNNDTNSGYPFLQPSVVGEAIAYLGLPSAGLEQTRDMSRNISAKVAANKYYHAQCNGFYDCGYNGQPLHNIWVAPVYAYSKVKSPYDYEAKIGGFEAGIDTQTNAYNRLGLFMSYRQGNYDFDGDGEDYFSKTGSEIDIDSYILGLYHRYDRGRLWVMSQIFGGYQDVEIASDDGVSSSTDGFEFGAGVEAGVVFNPKKDITIEPTLRVAYTQINYDDASDKYGKTAQYGDVSNVEAEFGVKFEKSYILRLRPQSYAKVYVKPSVIQNFGNGDVLVTSLRKVDGLENATLGRIEIGGSMNLDNRWSGYANMAYTFNSDYNSASINAGLNYAFQ